MTDSYLGTIRSAAGFSQLEAAEQMGKHQTIVSDWERGEYPPSDESFAIMAALYGVKESLLRDAVSRDADRYVARIKRRNEFRISKKDRAR